MRDNFAWSPDTGITAELVRRIDWSATPLGASENWPESLRTTVDLCLGCSFPMLVLWGPDFVQIYNDGYAEILGTRHPAAMGQPARECRPEVWHIDEPVYTQVHACKTLTDENVLYPVTRDGAQVDASFTVCYSPLRDNSGSVAGVLATFFETMKKTRESEQKFQNLFTASPVPFMVLAPNQPDFTITAANDAYLAATLNTRESLIGRRLFDVFTDDPTRTGIHGPEPLAVSLDNVLTSRQTDAMPRVRYDLKLPGGGFEPHWWEAINAPVLDASGRITAIIHQVTRVTELYLAEEAEREYREREAFLPRLSDKLRGIEDPNEIQQTAMQMLAEHLGLSRAFYFLVEQDPDGWVHAVDSEYLRVSSLPSMIGRHSLKNFGQFFDDLCRGETLQVDDVKSLPNLTQDELACYEAVGAAAFLNVPLLRNGMYSAGVTAHDAAPRAWKQAEIDLLREVGNRIGPAIERARAEGALRDSEERFRLFVENVREYALVQTDFEGIITSWNPGAERLFGYTSAEVVGKHFAMLVPEKDRHGGLIAREMAALSRGERSSDAHFMERKNGSCFFAEWVTEPVHDDNGKLRGTAKVMRDETERQRADEALRGSLAEKEALLAEVHHRVKNNLQVITSLLNLQSRGLKDEVIAALFNETRNRVQSIASIHEMLYRSGNFAKIDLFAYARQLVATLIRFYGAQSRVRVTMEGGGVSLELERAVPFGLLLNEIISNALKHGLLPSETGSLRVDLTGNEETIFLTVKDSGPGLPDDLQPEEVSSLGLRLIHILVRQLGGDIKFKSNIGTSVDVLIPVRAGTQSDERAGSTSQ